jgi:hypothetical protein
MVKVKEDLSGRCFGSLTVLRQAEDYISDQGVHCAQWLCQCSCGSEPKIIRQTSLKNGSTISCGCEHKQRVYDTSCKENPSAIRGLKDKHGDYCVGFCSNTNAEFYFDESDYDLIYSGEYCWYEYIDPKSDYHCVRARVRNFDGKYILLHQLLGCKSHDHIDRNPMNNRRYNLRPATQIENSRNKRKSTRNQSGIIGVCWHGKCNKWMSYITVDKKKIYLGVFSNKNDAIKTRLQAESRYFGEFAPQKHLYDTYQITIQNN